MYIRIIVNKRLIDFNLSNSSTKLSDLCRVV